MNTHRLKIRCPTWDHLENFYERKVKAGNLLLARVPFSPAIGDKLVIALSLPDGIVIELDAEVLGAKQAPDGRRSAIRMHLYGLDDATRERFVRAVARGRRGTERIPPFREAPVTIPRTQTGVPVPLPSDVPVDEEVVRAILPPIEDVPERVRDKYRDLDLMLRDLREKSAHDVLGVSWDADVAHVRKAYFLLVKRIHPDVLARHDSPDILLLASEIFIYVNQAYDRLRDSAVSAGKAIAAGPALLPHSGWSANFDEIGTVRPRQPLRSDDLSQPTAVPSTLSPVAVQAPSARDSIVIQFASGSKASVHAKPRIAKGKASSSGKPALRNSELFADARETQAGMEPIEAPVPAALEEEESDVDLEKIRAEGQAAMAAEDYAKARLLFAQVLEVAPRDRECRALYHVAFAHTLSAEQKPIEALTQLEVALKHNSECGEALDAKLKFEKKGGKKSRLRKWFRS